MNSRFIYIIFAILLVLLVNPFLRPLGLFGHLFSTLFLAMIPLSSAFALTENRTAQGQTLIDRARQFAPRELSPEERKRFFLE